MDNYQSLQNFIEHQIRLLAQPFSTTDSLLNIIQKYNDSQLVPITSGRKKYRSKLLKDKDFDKIIANTNDIINAQYQRYFSKQSISQIVEQVMTIWEEKESNNKKTMKKFQDFEFNFIKLQYVKDYSLEQLIKRIEDLPEVKYSYDREIDVYNNLRKSLTLKISRIKSIKKNQDTLKKYNQIISQKIHEFNSIEPLNVSIERNIPSKRNDELNTEISKLKVRLNKLINDAHDKKKRKLIKQYLDMDIEELKDILQFHNK
ncbi:hypothetical protein WICMUC_004821 [Wickerhamomyces mucosus]|uniref:Uncharacterized protein n=1 Tax=Wickerhamomyces mucosus TaxID=1378264 RepID=A0A9P8PFE2_9ASCO|nr:hypothetical protein WICMUC_004821 [Wickerhamomyces mucosus]